MSELTDDIGDMAPDVDYPRPLQLLAAQGRLHQVISGAVEQAWKDILEAAPVPLVWRTGPVPEDGWYALWESRAMGQFHTGATIYRYRDQLEQWIGPLPAPPQ